MENTIHIILNGEEKLIDANYGLLDLLVQLNLNPETKGVAVAIENQLVRKNEWIDFKLREGNRVEVITAAQGG